MAMPSYEVVCRAIEFRRPDRLPLRFEALGLSDTHSVPWNQIGTGDQTKRETTDEWGCIWRRSEVANMGQVKGHPLTPTTPHSMRAWRPASTGPRESM